MTYWEVRVFHLTCDHPGCEAEERVECPCHVLYALPDGWRIVRDGTAETIRCPEHAGVGE